MLRKAFGGGCLCVLLDLLIVLPMQAIFGDASEWHGFFWSTFGQAFLEAGIPEELCKFLVLYWLIWKAPEFDEHFDGIVYATFVSMGFACLENILYVFQYGAGTGIMRAVTAVPGHFFFAVVMGYYFSKAKFDVTNRKSNMIKCIIYPMIVHGIYDMILFMMTGFQIRKMIRSLILLAFCSSRSSSLISDFGGMGSAESRNCAKRIWPIWRRIAEPSII